MFDDGWRFHRGDLVPREAVWGFLKAGTHNQTGAARGLDDSGWRAVCLPHDFVMEGPVTPPEESRREGFPEMNYLGDLHVLHGCRAGGIAWYRKRFRVDSAGKRVYLKLDGAYRDSAVYVNEFLVGTHASGYTEAVYDITDFLRGEEENVAAVRVDAGTAEGWWYEGGGLYRHAWLIVTPLISTEHHGVFVKAELSDDRSRAVLTIETNLVNRSDEACVTGVRHRILAPGGEEAAVTAELPVRAGAGEGAKAVHRAELEKPALWDLDSPQLYTLVTELDGEEDVRTEFGVRSICFTADKGFFLNGRHVLLKGLCCHQDHAGLGTALPDGMQEYRVRRLRELGCNAYRASHHPASEELLRACDRLGMLVLDENRLLSSGQDELMQARDMVRGARNHPCVILWSIGNEEVHVQFTEQGRKIAASLRSAVRALDDTRPVTAAVCMWEAGRLGETVSGPERQGTLAPSLDVFGFNYFSEVWDEFHRAFPEKPLVATEESTFSETRGCRETRDEFCHMSALDRSKWNYRVGEREWKAVASREYLAGAFLWTGFDYHGEPTPYGWPAMASQFGVLDLCGFPKDTSFYYRAWWRDEPVLHLCAGEHDVLCFTNCEEVELFRGEESLGRRSVERYGAAEWLGLPSTNGLVAVGRRGGQETLRRDIRESGPPVRVEAQIDGVFPERDGSRTVVVNLALLDAEGNVSQDADNRVTLTISGDAELLGTGNGNPSCHEDVKALQRSAFHGLLQAVFRVEGNASLCADAASLSGAAIAL